MLILSDLKKSGVDLIELTGGEPLTHPKFNEILKYSTDLFSLISIITNGSLFNKKHADFISKYKDKIVMQISVYGSNSDYVDWFCGKKGAYKQSKKAIKLAAEKDIFVTSSMLLTPFNIDQLFSTVQLSKRLGASSFRISTIVPMGRATVDNLHFTPDNIKLLNDEILATQDAFGDFIFQIPEYLLKTDKNMTNCGAGTKSITLTPNGDVKICPLANTKHLYLGNLHCENIIPLLLKYNGLNFFELEDPRVSICKDCEFLWFCEGCIARGCSMYNEIGEKCRWGDVYFNNFIEKGEQLDDRTHDSFERCG